MRKHKIALSGEVAWDGAVDLLYDRMCDDYNDDGDDYDNDTGEIHHDAVILSLINNTCIIIIVTIR
jgi:hypothetical protein